MDLEVSLGLGGQIGKESDDQECFLFPFACSSVGHYFCEFSTFADASDILVLGGPTSDRLKHLLEEYWLRIKWQVGHLF